MAGIDLLRQRLYDKYKTQGMSDEEALMRADKESQVPEQTKPKKKESAIRRLARATKMAILGSRYKSDWQRRREQQQPETVRTKAVSGGLRTAGLTEAEIRRLRGMR